MRSSTSWALLEIEFEFSNYGHVYVHLSLVNKERYAEFAYKAGPHPIIRVTSILCVVDNRHRQRIEFSGIHTTSANVIDRIV
jgi:hypothetical protein